jgi:phage gp45-like
MNNLKDNYLLQNECSSLKENPVIEFSTGDSIVIDTIKEEVKLIDRNNQLQMTIGFAKIGLVININAAKININAVEELNLSGKKVNITATDQLKIQTAGNLVQQIDKDSLTEVGGSNKMKAKVQQITATLGDVSIKANDDIVLNGERVKLNCD